LILRLRTLAIPSVAVPFCNQLNDSFVLAATTRPWALRCSKHLPGNNASKIRFVSKQGFDRGGQLVLRFRFQQKCPGAGFEGLLNEDIAVMHREDQDFSFYLPLLYAPCDLNSVDQRQRIIDDCNVRLVVNDKRYGILPVVGSATTSQPMCVSKVARRPDRTTSWSSTITMRFVVILYKRRGCCVAAN
jgi:hypothetical protein